MGDKRKFILLHDRVGYTVERNPLSLGLSTKSTPTQVLRGDLLEALPEAEQPQDSTKIALVAINRFSRKLPGVVWYKGGLPSNNGTMFGVELILNPGKGTCDGTFRNKRYFICPPDCGVFVALDKLTPREDPDSKSPKRDENAGANLKSWLRGAEDTQMAVDNPHGIEVGSMVQVPMSEGGSRYGVIRWIGMLPQVKDKLVAGLELEEEQSACSDGIFNGVRYFTCPAGKGFFTLLKYCSQDSRSPSNNTSFNSEKANFQSHLREMEQQVSEKHEQEENLESQLREMEQQLREKHEQGENLQSQLREMQQQLREKDEQEENLESQLREMQQQLREKDEQEENLESQLREMEQQMREKDEQEENLQSQLREMQQQLTNLQDRYREKEDQTVNLLEQVTTQERELRVKEQQVNELEMTLSTAQQALTEEHRRQVTPDWVIPRDEIQLTDKLLGKGGWGSVVEGKYCGCAVAVKQIHELILSPHNRNLFEREMDIASRCRHPCLLQFIGATNDEEIPLFVTELMESSLRALLEQRPLAATEVSIISLDVARALNYLHQKKPSPIIHRDISSANVLLWRRGDQWRGKVSDYGTANFMQHTMTVGPGAAIYMAPEARTSNQTVKVDLYSFGVLLCEMCIRKLPDPERRDQQIAMVTSSLLRALVRRCLQSEPEARPNMEEIIEELEPSK